MTATVTGAPTSAATEIADRVDDAIAARATLRIAGRGSWLDAGHPVRAERTIALERFSGITEYVPGDLVLTALAGTSLREIAAATGKNGQWLPLDPFGSSDGTLGATIATASAGPLAHVHGGPRDLVLGVECVAGTGKIIRGGGRVTKNVAGFDLTRLLVGSWGTLGILTEISVRLRARPAVETTITMQMPLAATALRAQLHRVRSAPLEAQAIELLDPALAAAVGLELMPTLLVRLGGNADSVAAQRATLARCGPTAEIGLEIWDTLRGIEQAGASVWRLSDLPSRIADTWEYARASLAQAGTSFMHASIGRGIVRCISAVDRAPNPTDLREHERRDDRTARGSSAPLTSIAPSDFAGMTIVERLPADQWAMRSRATATDPVSRRIRESFDPHSLLNPGILGVAEP